MMKQTILITLFLCLVGLVQAQPEMPTGPTSLEVYAIPGYFVTARGTNSTVRVREGTDQDPAGQWVIVPALSGTAGNVSFQSVGYPGSTMRHQGHRLRTSVINAGDALGEADASWTPVPGLADPTNPRLVSFKSENFGFENRHMMSDIANLGNLSLYSVIITDQSTPEELARATFMFPDPTLATKPYPPNGSDEVLLDVGKLTWKPGEGAITHNVFIGTDVNSVRDATVSDTMGTTLYAGLDVNNVDLARLAYGTTYYWRVDEIPGSGAGLIWSFTTEPEAVELAVENIDGVESYALYGTVYEGQEPNTTFDGTGLAADGTHSNENTTMWLGMGDGPGDVWLQYELDDIYKLFELKIWNYNEEEPYTSFGAKDVNVTYSIDGVTWDALDEIQTLLMGTGESTYEANNFIDMNGAIAKYVRLTFLDSYTPDLYTGGISEIKFSVIPTRPSNPSPANNATNVNLNSIISWKAGRDADIHKIYIDSDKSAVEGGTAGIIEETVDPNYSIDLELGTTYYWKVEEINDTEDYPVWEGPVWKFATQQYILVDGFETGYDNSEVNAVFVIWQDGDISGDSDSGSWMGRSDEPYLQTINHSGGHSAPMAYNNVDYDYSEVVADTSMIPTGIGSDWTKGNPNALEIWFRSDANDVNEPVLDKLYAAFNGGSRIYYDGDAANIRKASWSKFEVPLDGVNLSNVTSITIGVEKIGSTGGIGTLYFDDIRLGISAEPVNPGTDNLIARYEMEGNVNDTSGSGFDGDPNNGNLGNGGLTYEAGKYGQALVFDGNDDYVSLPIGETISTLTSCTISTWVNYAGGGVWQKVFDFGSDTNIYMDLSANNNSNGVRTSITTGSWQNEDGANSPSILAIGSWEHLVVVLDKENGTMKLYRNGDLSGSDDDVTTFPEDLGVTTMNYLGRSVWPDNPNFNGMIDDFRIYDRALTAGEVKYLFKNE